jgi:hypothetical protein
MMKNIGFVSTRFAGSDAVSLESSKRAEVFEDNGFSCFWFAGEVERKTGKTFIRDIEPPVFGLAVMDGFLPVKTVKNVRKILESLCRL